MENSSRIRTSFLLVLLILCSRPMFSAEDNPYCMGADVSWVQQQEDKGLTFRVNEVGGDVLDFLSKNGFNWIRLRLFVEPSAEKGYSRQGYCDLEHTVAMAKRVKAAGMKFLLDFHYSDTWADPGKQFKPSSWEGLTGKDLEKRLYDYTREVLLRFKKEGVLPDMVQVGNEINHGMVWPDGKADSTLLALSGLLRSGCKAVRSVSPKIQRMIHLACGGQNKESVWFLDKIKKNGVRFEVIGQSYYPEYHGTLEELTFNLTDLAKRYHQPIVVVEYQVFRKEINDIVFNLPDKKGMGSFIWEATSPRWGNLFDKDGTATEYLQLYPEMAKRYGARR